MSAKPTSHAAEPRSPSQAEVVERLFREHNESLIRFLMTRVSSFQEAREVAQEAYVRLLSLHKPGAVSFLRAFLYKTAANLATDRTRRERVHHRAAESPLFHEFVDLRSPERCVAGFQEFERLEKLLDELPPKCRQAFVLSRFHGMDTAAVARKMGLKERMVHTYIVRAMLYCRSRFDSDATQEQDHG